MICETDTYTEIVYDPNPRPRFPLLKEMWVEQGSKADWNLLHELHYKAENLPMGPRFWRLTLAGDTIGVMVTGSPKGLLAPRHIAFPLLKPGAGDTKLTNTMRYEWLNANSRLLARIVTDPIYRGVGIGYRFQNLAMRLEGSRFVEIQSSMSKFNLFAQRAGCRFVPPMTSRHYEKGLQFFRSHFSSNPADSEAIVAEIEAMPETLRERSIADTKDFYFKHSALEKTGNNREHGAGRVAAMDIRTTIKALQQLILASPMYGVWENPDVGRKLPERLPLTAFDTQKPTEPLKECQ